MKIAFAGAQGTGKTTTLEALNGVLELPVLKSPGRRVMRQLGLESVADARAKGKEPELQRMVAQAIAIEHGSSREFISDRSIFDSAGYDAALGLTSLDYDRLIKRYRVRYDMVFILPIEFAAPDDGVRSTDEAERRNVQAEIVECVMRSGMPHAVLSGSVDERVQEALYVLSAIGGRKAIKAAA